MDETPKQTSGGRDVLLPASILVAALMISGSLIYFVRQGAPGSATGVVPGAPQTPPSNAQTSASILEIRERDVILGDPKAPVTIIEYGDYQCPFCGRFFEQTEPLIKDNYVRTGKASMIYRNYAFLGSESTKAAEAAECAKDQGKFWLYHDAIYAAEVKDGVEGNGNLNRDLFLRLAREAGLDAGAFTACYDGNKYADAVANERRAAEGDGVDSTPTTFVNTQKINGAVPYAQFAAAIDKFLTSK
ncbi:MAG: hypothetical protein A3A43_00165 [Candidatus Liptonbacteria bacterium RIFCSPLOWO2_01_FULL_56_20]|uniref:Thioredoxin domain-containing protein n=1 Tax=Candidatus Liptonbacteria bacterium RIFCSPLOWO2_01_FULL_56_20 TaxID=1798652 RepID=A0A1G2CIQ6_9BACT|nr:MAG: hypothetical protein UY96_C0002G0064 [Parcubacteria group bacterium GW2011_GWB1_56_8]OGY97715.1 MAG: hypothetical protein A2681_01585 [Candidatus Liptonbacteria bacterium RIFCSPHIGHO2_01_FULL_56_18b]OGZ01265.1 MAG: hypothetical protein A3A43_00165 [Candidatus Liptonbacteria bacterium RIFCSPLOWO2_01_FULL_56_20]